MTLKDKLDAKKAKLLSQYKDGKKVTEQMKAERMRKKIINGKNYGPGSVKYGMQHRQNPIDFMKDAYAARKTKREEKKK